MKIKHQRLFEDILEDLGAIFRVSIQPQGTIAQEIANFLSTPSGFSRFSSSGTLVMLGEWLKEFGSSQYEANMPMGVGLPSFCPWSLLKNLESICSMNDVVCAYIYIL